MQACIKLDEKKYCFYVPIIKRPDLPSILLVNLQNQILGRHRGG